MCVLRGVTDYLQFVTLRLDAVPVLSRLDLSCPDIGTPQRPTQKTTADPNKISASQVTLCDTQQQPPTHALDIVQLSHNTTKLSQVCRNAGRSLHPVSASPGAHSEHRKESAAVSACTNHAGWPQPHGTHPQHTELSAAPSACVACAKLPPAPRMLGVRSCAAGLGTTARP